MHAMLRTFGIIFLQGCKLEVKQLYGRTMIILCRFEIIVPDHGLMFKISEYPTKLKVFKLESIKVSIHHVEAVQNTVVKCNGSV